MNVAPCFTSDLDDYAVHLRDARVGTARTLCGKRAMPPLIRPRSRITCEKCLGLKPKILGGT